VENDILQWLQGPRDFNEGLMLYFKNPDRPQWPVLQQGETERNRDLLLCEMKRIAGISERPGNNIVDDTMLTNTGTVYILKERQNIYSAISYTQKKLRLNPADLKQLGKLSDLREQLARINTIIKLQ
jgi:hypothetical protein